LRLLLPLVEIVKQGVAVVRSAQLLRENFSTIK
jgi:hypothetical protein